MWRSRPRRREAILDWSFTSRLHTLLRSRFPGSPSIPLLPLSQSVDLALGPLLESLSSAVFAGFSASPPIQILNGTATGRWPVVRDPKAAAYCGGEKTHTTDTALGMDRPTRDQQPTHQRAAQPRNQPRAVVLCQCGGARGCRCGGLSGDCLYVRFGYRFSSGIWTQGGA